MWLRRRWCPRQLAPKLVHPRIIPKPRRETAAGVSVVDSTRCPGDWRRYGADPGGSADSTAAIQAACNANTLAFDAAGGTYLVSATIVIPSGVTWCAAPEPRPPL